MTNARTRATTAHAEHRLGEEQKATPKATGAAGSKSAVPNEYHTQPATLEEKGLDKKRSARAQKLADIPIEAIDQIADELEAKGKAVTPAAILAAQRQENKETKKHDVATSLRGRRRWATRCCSQMMAERAAGERKTKPANP